MRLIQVLEINLTKRWQMLGNITEVTADLGNSRETSAISRGRQDAMIRPKVDFSWGFFSSFLRTSSFYGYSTTTPILWSGLEAHDSTDKITVPLWRFRMATACSWVTPSRVPPLTAKIWSPRFNRPSSAAAPYKQETFQFNPGRSN